MRIDSMDCGSGSGGADVNSILSGYAIEERVRYRNVMQACGTCCGTCCGTLHSMYLTEESHAQSAGN